MEHVLSIYYKGAYLLLLHLLSLALCPVEALLFSVYHLLVLLTLRLHFLERPLHHYFSNL